MDCKKTIVLLIAVIGFVPAIVFATDFTVGDDKGWNLGVNYTEWAKGKVFKVGDKLIFNYKTPTHNVVKVDASNFQACTAPAGAEALVSGQEEITLAAEGRKWYLCSKPGHCDGGMKLVINVVSDTESPAASPPSPTSSSTKIASFQYQILMAIAAAMAMAIMI